MRKLTCAIATICTLFAFSAEKKMFTYVDIHAMGAYPMVGVGVRTQKGFHAFDLSANVYPLSPLDTLHIFQVRALYLIYPLMQGLYVGGGIGVLKDPEIMKRPSGSLEATVGYQWSNHAFLEFNLSKPFKKFYSEHKEARDIQVMPGVWPGVTFGIGF